MQLKKLWEGEGENSKLLIPIKIKSVFRPKWKPSGYERIGIIIPRKNAVFPTKEVLEQYVKYLNEKFPERGFKLIQKGNFLILTQNSYRIDENGKKKRKKDYISLYFDLEKKEIYIPSSFLKERKYLRSYLLMVALSSLKLTTTIYK